MRMRNDSASILIVGCRSTKRLICSTKISITIIARMTAVIITPICFTMPTAVMTESSEKTMSMSRIWMMTLTKVGARRLVTEPSSPSSFSWISFVLLAMRNNPPRRRIKSLPDTARSQLKMRACQKGLSSETNHASEHSSRMRVMSASARPTLRAFACCSAGSLPLRIEMKMRLSMPSTISSNVSVKRLIQICGSESHSITRRSVGGGRHFANSEHEYLGERGSLGLWVR